VGCGQAGLDPPAQDVSQPMSGCCVKTQFAVQESDRSGLALAPVMTRSGDMLTAGISLSEEASRIGAGLLV
jgi:hypothetical protein